MGKRSIPAHPKEKTTDLPRLRADANFQKLAPAQQDVLVDYCHGTFPAELSEREDDAVMMCRSMLFDVAAPVRDTVLGLCKPSSRVLRRLLGFSSNGSFQAPKLDDKPLSGGDRDAAQQRLVQLMAYLARHEDSAQGQRRQQLITNTIEWFILLGLPLEHKTFPALGEYDPKLHKVFINHDAMRLTASGVGEETETVRILAHEVNHACRRGIEESEGTHMVDELHGYVTGLIAGGQVVSRDQVASTFSLLEGEPYNMRKVIRSQVGLDYQRAIKYEDHGTYELLVYPLPSPGTANTGWHHTNALPGF